MTHKLFQLLLFVFVLGNITIAQRPEPNEIKIIKTTPVTGDALGRLTNKVENIEKENQQLKKSHSELEKEIANLKGGLQLLGLVVQNTKPVIIQIKANDKTLTKLKVLPKGYSTETFDGVRIDNPASNNNPNAKIVITGVIPALSQDNFSYDATNLGGVLYAYFHPLDKSWYILMYKNAVKGMISSSTNFEMKFVNVQKGDIYNVLISK